MTKPELLKKIEERINLARGVESSGVLAGMFVVRDIVSSFPDEPVIFISACPKCNGFIENHTCPKERVKWEYKIIKDITRVDDEILEEAENEGWELIWVENSRFYFKRPKI